MRSSMTGNRLRWLLLPALVLVLALACLPTSAWGAAPVPPLAHHGRWITDADGRVTAGNSLLRPKSNKTDAITGSTKMVIKAITPLATTSTMIG